MVRPDGDTEIDGDEESSESSRVAKSAPRAPQLTRLGRYRLVKEIASGGMASVNLAVTEGLDKLVALKLIHPHLAGEEAFVHMFLDEARIASSISHRNVCNTFDFGEADGRYYIAMDYLAGQSLRDLIFRLRRVTSEAEPKRLAVYMAYVIAEACEGLHAAHELRDNHGHLLDVVHRDVSPHNLFVTYDGNVSVVDFGIARAANRLQHTATGILKGKFSYMAPEQVRQSAVDRRADIWSLGVCLWECLTLERLFVRSNQADTLMSVMMDKVRMPSEVRPELPKELDAIVAKALSRELDQRYATAREMGRDLMKFVRASGVLVGPVEIEHWLENLFARERDRARALMRQAKKDAFEASWPEGNPSLLPRSPSRSGLTPVKSPASGSTPRPEALSHPAVPLRPESERDLTGAVHRDASTHLPRRNMFLAALAGLALAMGVSWAFEDNVVAPSGAEHAAASASSPQKTKASAVLAAAPAPAAIAAKVEPERLTPSEPAALPPQPARTEGSRTTFSTRVKPGTIASRTPVTTETAPAATPEAPAEATKPDVSAALAPAAEAPVTTPAAPAQAPVEAAPTVEVKAPPAAQPSVSKAFVPARVSAVFDALNVEGSLGKSAVTRMLGRATPLIQSCYESAAQRAAKHDFASLDVTLTIDETGAVRTVETGAHPLSGMARCVGDSVKRLRSESKPDIGTVRVRLQVSFRPQ